MTRIEQAKLDLIILDGSNLPVPLKNLMIDLFCDYIHGEETAEALSRPDTYDLPTTYDDLMEFVSKL